MQYTTLGRTGLAVSRLCLGSLNFGWLTEQDESFAILDLAHEVGINLLDTADEYGGALGEGKFGVTEALIGDWFGQGGGRRERTVLATKLYHPMGDWPNQGRLSALHIRQACEASLRRLGTDYIDIYQMHHIDRTTPWEEIWEAMDVLRHQGKILYVGSSNFAGWHLAQAQHEASIRSMLGLVSEQAKYNLLNRDIEREVLPAAEAYGIGVLPYSPLAGGLLGGYIAKERGLRRTTDEFTYSGAEGRLGDLEEYEKLCSEIGEEPATVALAWLLSRPGVTAPVIGPRTTEQFTFNLRALDVALDQAVLDRLDELFPGYKTGPEDWAY